MTTETSPVDQDIAPETQRIRFELKRRELEVIGVERLTPHMIRITLAGPDLASFESASFDDHLKVLVPGAGEEPELRDYTPRRFDREACTLVLDFVDHDGGPASDWARGAKLGDSLKIAGPRGSKVIGGAIDKWVLIGDETALPAMGRKAEELGKGDSAVIVAGVTGAAEEQSFETDADLELHWVHRPASTATDAAPYLPVLEGLDLGPRTFVWIAAEAGAAKALRRYVIEEGGHPARWVKAAGYWVAGKADSAEKDIGGE